MTATRALPHPEQDAKKYTRTKPKLITARETCYRRAAARSDPGEKTERRNNPREGSVRGPV